MIQEISDKVDKAVRTANSNRNPVKNSDQRNYIAKATLDKQPVPTKQQVVPASAEQPDANKVSVDKAVSKVNGELKKMDEKLSLSIDKDTNRVLIRFKDPSSGQVVRQIPSEVVLKMVKRFDDLRGVILDMKS